MASSGDRPWTRGIFSPTALTVWGALTILLSYLGLGLQSLAMSRNSPVECPGSPSPVPFDEMRGSTSFVSHPPPVLTCVQADGTSVTYWLSFPVIAFSVGAVLIGTALMIWGIRMYRALHTPGTSLMM